MNIKNISEVREIIDKLGVEKPNVFLETGTFIGQTSFEMSKYFDKVLTVEIDDKLHKDVVGNAIRNGVKNISFYKGDSSVAISDMMKEIKDEPTIFFLDGHYSGIVEWDATGETDKKNGRKTHPSWSTDWEFKEWPEDGRIKIQTGRGVKDVPLMGELKSIDKNHNNTGIVIIDDFHLFGGNHTHGDWRNLSVDMVLNVFDNYIV